MRYLATDSTQQNSYFDNYRKNSSFNFETLFSFKGVKVCRHGNYKCKLSHLILVLFANHFLFQAVLKSLFSVPFVSMKKKIEI